MDFSVTDNEDLNHEQDRAEQEKRKLAEELEKTKTEYEQALASKNCEVSLEIERIKKHMCRGITQIHRSPSRPRPSMRPTAAFINIHEHLI